MTFIEDGGRRRFGPLTLVVLTMIVFSILTVQFRARSSQLKIAADPPSRSAQQVVQKSGGLPTPGPKIGPPDPQPLDPPDSGPLPMPANVGQLLVGPQVGVVQFAYDTHLFTTTSFYEFVPTTEYVDVAAGSFTAKPDQGVVRILELGPKNSDLSYPTPSATGPLTMVSVTSSSVALISSTGVSYKFDLVSRAFT